MTVFLSFELSQSSASVCFHHSIFTMASTIAFSHAQRDQLQSPLFRLPPELRNHIFSQAMLTSSPITDPVPANYPVTYGRPQECYHDLPPLGTNLLLTCQRAYLETDSSLLLSNDLSFTSPSHIFSFASHLPKTTTIKSLTISLRQTNLFQSSSDGTPSAPLAAHWLHFLTCPTSALHPPTIWCSVLPTLATLFPKLESLTFDLKGLAANCPASGSKSSPVRALGKLIRSMRKPEGLKSIAVRGEGKHIWDLGDVSRPGPCGEWIAVDAWTKLVGGEVVSALHVGLGAEEEEGWTGVVRKDDGEFEIVARRSELCDKEKREQGISEATSWDEVLRLTSARDRHGHPAFALFD